jgi:membrane protease subunit HflK
VNFNEIRALSIGTSDAENFQDTGFLQSISPPHISQFMTGDKNILNLQVNVHYRISEQHCRDYLYASEAPERRLKLVVEATVAGLIARSGVDFVHPLGLGQLREMLTAQTRLLADSQRLGIDVEEVAINSVSPPVLVKADFLDVQNARADREKFINAARAYAVSRLEAARAESKQRLDAAQIYCQRATEAARGSAESFNKLVAQLKAEESAGVQSYADARQMAMQRLYVDSMRDILGKVAGKVVLDSGKEVDLTIFRDPKE